MPPKGQELRHAICRLESEIREGLAHGFFELSLTCEVIKGGKRRLTIKAGKSYQFVIPEDGLNRNDGNVSFGDQAGKE